MSGHKIQIEYLDFDAWTNHQLTKLVTRAIISIARHNTASVPGFHNILRYLYQLYVFETARKQQRGRRRYDMIVYKASFLLQTSYGFTHSTSPPSPNPFPVRLTGRGTRGMYTPFSKAPHTRLQNNTKTKKAAINQLNHATKSLNFKPIVAFLVFASLVYQPIACVRG